MVRRFLQLLREHSGEGYKSRGRQLLDVLELVGRGHLHPAEYFYYGLSKEGITVADTSLYMSNRFHWESHLPKLNDPRWFVLMDNKWLFHLHYRNLVPLPRFLGVYHPVHGITDDHMPLRTPEDVLSMLEREGISEFVVKPVAGSQGAGVQVVQDVRVGAHEAEFDLSNGKRVGVADFFASMGPKSDGRTPGAIVEGRLKQHPGLREIAPYAINTARVVTLSGPSGVSIATACVRLASAGSMVDNFSAGGYCAFVDPDTGVIGRGRRESGTGARMETHHSDSGVRFEGRTVPMWDEVREVCRVAAEAAPGLRSVGWDVVVTPSGPVLLEGNQDWGLLMCQAVGGGFLRPAVAEELRALGVSVTPEHLPPYNPRRALSSLFGTWG